MGVLAYDDVLVREPRLMVPGQKPVGPVKIDWTHPFARKVTFFIGLFNSTLIDLVTNRLPVYGGSCVGRDLGDGWRSGGGANQYCYFDLDPRANVTGRKAVAFSGWTDDGDADSFFRGWDLTTEKFQAGNYYTTDFSMYFHSTTAANRTALGFVAAARKPVHVMCSGQLGSTNIAVGRYDGSWYDETTGGGLNSGSDATGITQIYIGARPSNTASLYDVGIFYLVGWNRTFTKAEMQQFLLDPYQFLIPV